MWHHGESLREKRIYGAEREEIPRRSSFDDEDDDDDDESPVAVAA